MPNVPPFTGRRPAGSGCARLGVARSQFVDGSIGGDARAELLQHLNDCPGCRSEVAELRRIRALLSNGGSAGPDGLAAARLHERLVSIAEGTEDDPLWARPFRRVEAKPLPSPRRALRRRAVVAATALSTLVVAGAGVGYLAAPTAAVAIGDPTDASRSEFAAARAGLPLTDDAATAAMTVGGRWAAITPSADASRPVSLSAPVSLSPPSGGSDALRYRPTTSPTGRRLTAAQALAVLTSSQRASARVRYSGIEQVISSDGSAITTASVALNVVPGQGSELAVSDLGGARIGGGSMPSAGGTTESLATLLSRSYRLRGLGDVVLLGRRASVIEARPSDESDAGPASARWWIDQQTGVLLGRQTYDAAGALVQSSMLASLSLGSDPVAPGPAVPLVTSVATTSLTPAVGAELDRAGWTCRQTVAGLSLVEVRTDVAADPGLVHLIYSDGVWTVSVFERHGVLTEAPAGSSLDPVLGAYLTPGSPRLASWQSGDAVFTVATDGPASLLTGVVGSLPHDRHRAPTTMERVQAGWSRVGSSMFG